MSTLDGYIIAEGISDSEFARRIGVSPMTVGRWRRGERRPNNKDLLDKIFIATDGAVDANSFYLTEPTTQD